MYIYAYKGLFIYEASGTFLSTVSFCTCLKSITSRVSDKDPYKQTYSNVLVCLYHKFFLSTLTHNLQSYMDFKNWRLTYHLCVSYVKLFEKYCTSYMCIKLQMYGCCKTISIPKIDEEKRCVYFESPIHKRNNKQNKNACHPY